MTPTTNHRVSARRGEILRIAVTIFASKGFSNATVRDIADAAGILSGSLYHHFTSKEEMVEEILASCLRTVLEAYEEVLERATSPREAIKELMLEAFHAVARDPASITVLHNDWPQLRKSGQFVEVEELTTKIESLWVEAIEQGQRIGEFRADLDPRLVFRVLMGAVLNTVRWFDPEGDYGIGHVADHHLSLMLHGLVVDPDFPRDRGAVS